MPRIIKTENEQISHILNNCVTSDSREYNGTKCIEWTKVCDTLGYGIVKWNNKKYFAHRLIWGLINNKISELDDNKEILILHHCDNPKCCNYSHLFQGTHKDNMIDRDTKNRQPKGENNGSAKLSKEQIIEIRNLYANGNITQKEISEIYNIDRSSVSYIVNRVIWKDV